jgi:predicted dehydrogenase
MNETKVRWGILGTAEIAKKIWKAIQLTGNARVAAVASRDLHRSRKFITACQAEAPMEAPAEAFGSYQELLASKQVDAVYIPLPTALRREWVIKASEAGKHVVCEKPCAANVSDLKEMLAHCRKNKVQFMDGVMFVHSSRFERMRQSLQSNSVGNIKRITSGFSFYGGKDFLASNIRAQSDLEPLGCLGDLGWYCVRLALWAMNMKLPIEVTGRLITERVGGKANSPVPTEFSGELLFADGISSAFYCSFETELQQWGIISGTGGYLQISDFVLPFLGNELRFGIRKSDYQINGCDFRMKTDLQETIVSEWSHGHADAQEVNCYRAFSRQILSGLINDSWPEAALKTQTVIGACLESARSQGRRIQI